jgi:RNA polymerase I specific transcription initiation factor RRN3
MAREHAYRTACVLCTTSSSGRTLAHLPLTPHSRLCSASLLHAAPPTPRPDEFKELIHSLFEYGFRGEARAARAYARLLLQLTSANSTYVVPALHTLVRALALAPGEESSAAAGAAAATAAAALVHATLRAMLALVPGGCSRLFRALSAHFPHRRRAAAALAHYATQALVVARYVPVVAPRLLRLLMERCLEMDVEIRIMEGGEAVLCGGGDEEEEVIFSMEVGAAVALAVAVAPVSKVTIPVVSAGGCGRWLLVSAMLRAAVLYAFCRAYSVFDIATSPRLSRQAAHLDVRYRAISPMFDRSSGMIVHCRAVPPSFF